MLLVTQISGTLFEVKFDGKLRPWLLTRWEGRDGKKHVD
jgi:ABC-type transport system substrate-binding protein